jgi:hypothetical protein
MKDVIWIARESTPGNKISVSFAKRLLARLDSGDPIKNLGWSADELRAAIAKAEKGDA